MNRFKELKVWQAAIDLAVEVYTLTKKFPKEEKYGLTSQITRSAVSISSNIAEGAGRNSDKEFKQYLAIANGSCCELESQLIIAEKLNYISNEELSTLMLKITPIQNMSFKLQETLKSKIYS